MDIIQDKCGVCVTHSLHDAINVSDALDHRGKEAFGVAGVSDDRIDVVRYIGRVKGGVFDLQGLYRVFNQIHPKGCSAYHSFMGMTRYATEGREDRESLLMDAGPAVIGGKFETCGSYVVIQDADMALIMNGQVHKKFTGNIDPAILKTGSDTERVLHFYRENGLRQLLRSIPGAYTLAIADKRVKDVLVARDRTGIRPGVIGRKGFAHLMASEDIALRKNGADMIVENLIPGSIYRLSSDGSYTRNDIVPPNWARCWFELNYLADPASIIDGVPVNRARELAGSELAAEVNLKDIDMVTDVPRCPEISAIAFAEASGIPYAPIFNKAGNDRAFIDTDPELRRISIENNLFLLPNVGPLLLGQTIGLIDDCIVRGNNIKVALALLDKMGVKKTYVLSYTPPIGPINRRGEKCGCEFGIDTPPEHDNFFIRAEDGSRMRSAAELDREINLDLDGNPFNMEVKLKYLTKKGMNNVMRSLGIKVSDLCRRCIGGEHPFKGLEGMVDLTVEAS